MIARCDLTDLPVDGCAHCRGVPDSTEVTQVRHEEEREARR